MVHATGEVNEEIVASRYTRPHVPRLFAHRGEGQRRAIRRLLSGLSPDVARRIGYENAGQLYKLGQ